MNITQDIQDAINKNLPQAVGDTLRERLDQADRDNADLTKLRVRYEQLKKDHDALCHRIEALDDELKKHVVLDAREQVVSKRERDADLHAMTVRATAAESNAEFARNVALGLVRNTEYRQNLGTSSNKTYPGQNGYSVTESQFNNGTNSTTAA